MYEITIKGNTPAELFANLAQLATGNTNTVPAIVSAARPTVTQPVPIAAPAGVETVMSATPVPVSQVTSEPSVVPPPGVPVAAPTYTIDMLARAGAALTQAGKTQEALALLAKYGVQTVNQLKPEQYGAFATELRALGAQI